MAHARRRLLRDAPIGPTDRRDFAVMHRQMRRFWTSFRGRGFIRCCAIGISIAAHLGIVLLLLKTALPSGPQKNASHATTEIFLGIAAPNKVAKPLPKASPKIVAPVALHHSSNVIDRIQASTDGTSATAGASSSDAVSNEDFTISSAAGPNDPSDSITEEFRRRLLTHIASYQNYPGETGQDRPHGEVYIDFIMNRAGAILKITVLRTSGSALLDDTAIDVVKRSQPLPAIPDNLSDPLDVELPISFHAP